MIYSAYASVYEAIGQGAFAEELLEQIIGALPVLPQRALDLACGTGAATLALAAKGVEVTGVDRSPEMLAIARAKARDRGLAATFVEADLRVLSSLSLRHSSFDLVTCLYDSLNYLTEDEDLARVCDAVAALLQPGGRFVFDLNTEHEFLGWDEGDQVVYDAAGVLVYNKLSYAPDEQRAYGRIVWFVRDDDERWWRGEEEHIERAWADAEVLDALADAGLRLLARRTPRWEPAPPDTPRVVYEAIRK